jgi:hypothetical protein
MLLAIIVSLIPIAVSAQPVPTQKPKRPEPTQQQKAVQESLINLIDSEVRIRRDLAQIRRRLRFTEDVLVQRDLEAQLADKREELRTTSLRLEELATGIPPEDINLPDRPKFDVEEEMQQLVEPFISMMKSATEEARQIERLRQLKRVAEDRIELANRAIIGIEALMVQTEAEAPRKRLSVLLKNWEERLAAARDLSVSTERQLDSRINKKGQASASGKAIGDFISTRGRNLFVGFMVFLSVLIALRFIGLLGHNLLMRFYDANLPRNFTRRIVRLSYNIIAFVLACVSMLLVFDYFNDWLLFGLGIITFAAGVWYLLKALPSLMHQATLLLNLGAVQEGERVIFKGVPFLVKKLDFYSELVNPKMRGGHFVIPIAELQGYHSRPVAKNEVWFPCSEGDTVILSDERWGRITFISPETVVMQDDGGSDNTFETADFLSLSPRNMSCGYRTESEFGVDYRHQAIATTDIPRIMAKEVRKDLEKRFGKDKIRNVAVEFIEAGDSALIYEVEADMTGAAAWQWEEVKFALAKFATDSCTRNGWTIPFPQLTLSKSPAQ